jgi:hypothetical protein
MINAQQMKKNYIDMRIFLGIEALEMSSKRRLEASLGGVSII